MKPALAPSRRTRLRRTLLIAGSAAVPILAGCGSGNPVAAPLSKPPEQRTISLGQPTTTTITPISDTSRVVAVSFSPTPVGPQTMVAATSPRPGLFVPLRDVASSIPARLPPVHSQLCTFGVVVHIAFADGGSAAYGPCVRPPAIDRLRRAIIAAVLSTHHIVKAHNPAGDFPWRSLLKDWYDDGRIEQWHPCASVYSAIRHLPTDMKIYSPVKSDLLAYARAIC